MKKPLLIIGVIGLVGLAAVLIFAGAPQEPTEVALESPAPTHASAPEETPTPESTPAASEAAIADLPEATTETLAEAALAPTDEAELQFLTVDQKKELTAASIGNQQPKVRPEQTISVTWKEGDLAAAVPALPAEAPVYLLDRPTDSDVFDVVKSIADSLGIDGTVIRSNKQNYAVANIMTGEYFLFYDLFHLTFEATDLALAIADPSEIKSVLTDAGLLGFPYAEGSEEVENATWYTFTPALPLPVVTMEQYLEDGTFEAGKVGSVDVAVMDGEIVEILNGFPNITEKSTTALADAATIATRLEEGSFRLGTVDLQYPGALPLEDKRNFFNLKEQNAIAIADAEISKVECGYLLETEESVQALLAPVCIAHGQGRVENYSVLFRVALPAAN